MKKINIVLTYIAYPLAMGTYFIRALQRREDINLTVAGPYTGTFIPWKGGMNLAPKYAISPEIPLPSSFQPSYNPAVIESQLQQEPDLWLQIDAGYHASRKPKSKIVATVATDPHAIAPPFYDEPRAYSDYFFNMQTPYMKGNDYWLPYACDPIWHRSVLDETHQKLYDGACIGLTYVQREKWAAELVRQGYKIRLETGIIGEECRDIYAHAKVGMNWSSLLDLNARAFELMGMGVCPVMNRVPDLHPLFEEGVHYLGFDTLEEGVEQFVRAVHDPDLRERIGKMASHQVHTFHSWDRRVDQILEVVGLA